MDDITKNLVAIVFFAILLASMAVTLFVIIKVQSNDESVLGQEYVVSVQIANAITSIVLSFIVLTDANVTTVYKIFILSLLCISVVAEIYYTGYLDPKFEQVPTYVIIVLSFLVRAFFLYGYAKGAFPQSVQTAIKPVEQAVNTVTEPVKNAVNENIVKPIQDVAKPVRQKSELVDKWDKLKAILRERPEGVANLNDPWGKVIQPAERAGRTDIKEVLKEAVGLLKDKEGNPVPLNVVDSVGGARK